MSGVGLNAISVWGALAQSTSRAICFDKPSKIPVEQPPAPPTVTADELSLYVTSVGATHAAGNTPHTAGRTRQTTTSACALKRAGFWNDCVGLDMVADAQQV